MDACVNSIERERVECIQYTTKVAYSRTFALDNDIERHLVEESGCFHDGFAQKHKIFDSFSTGIIQVAIVYPQGYSRSVRMRLFFLIQKIPQ